jgi:hypothetical protein
VTCTSAYVIIRQHPSASVSTRQHPSVSVSIRQHTCMLCPALGTRAPLSASATQHLRCQYLYFCTSNSSKSSTLRASGSVLPRPLYNSSLPKLQYLYFCTSKASKASTLRASGSVLPRPFYNRSLPQLQHSIPVLRAREHVVWKRDSKRMRNSSIKVSGKLARQHVVWKCDSKQMRRIRRYVYLLYWYKSAHTRRLETRF